MVTASSAILELLADLVMDVLLYMFGLIKLEKNYKTSSGFFCHTKENKTGHAFVNMLS